jgi:hypothetical protein
MVITVRLVTITTLAETDRRPWSGMGLNVNAVGPVTTLPSIIWMAVAQEEGETEAGATTH